MDSQEQLKSRVRAKTDYDTEIIEDSELIEIINIAEDEIRSDVGDPTLSFYQGNDTFDLDLALFWLSCLFVKVKSGEIEGPTLSLGELRQATLTAGASFWMERFEKAIHRYDDFRGYGIRSLSRDEREYGESF